MIDIPFRLTANKSSCTYASKPLPGKSVLLPTCRFLHYQASYCSWPLLIYAGRHSREWKEIQDLTNPGNFWWGGGISWKNQCRFSVSQAPDSARDQLQLPGKSTNSQQTPTGTNGTLQRAVCFRSDWNYQASVESHSACKYPEIKPLSHLSPLPTPHSKIWSPTIPLSTQGRASCYQVLHTTSREMW